LLRARAASSCTTAANAMLAYLHCSQNGCKLFV
jgi:hypothetical protein